MLKTVSRPLGANNTFVHTLMQVASWWILCTSVSTSVKCQPHWNVQAPGVAVIWTQNTTNRQTNWPLNHQSLRPFLSTVPVGGNCSSYLLTSKEQPECTWFNFLTNRCKVCSNEPRVLMVESKVHVDCTDFCVLTLAGLRHSEGDCKGTVTGSYPSNLDCVWLGGTGSVRSISAFHAVVAQARMGAELILHSFCWGGVYFSAGELFWVTMCAQQFSKVH